MDLSRIDWSAAAVELADEHRRTNAPRARRTLAAVSSLRGRFTDEFSIAAAATTAAMKLEPLDPIHAVRDALVRLRFGDPEAAIARLDALPEQVGDLPLVLVVKALAAARRGEPRTARNIADRALQVDPKNAAARFLYTETNLAAAQKGGLDKLAELPRGAAHDAAWADLLAKLAILRPGDLRAVNQHLGTITKGSRAEAVARTVAAWAAIEPAAAAQELTRVIGTLARDSRAEQVAVGLFVGKLGEPMAAARALRILRDTYPDRPAIRRALAVVLTRVAVVEAGNEKFAAALRAVQMCIELEPHEAVHYQNRAALFTLMGEHDAALDAWAELDRHHYRLALVGRIDARSAMRYAAPHRMFSQAARLAPFPRRDGVFVLEESKSGAIVERTLSVNQESLDKDPEQLRQWLHHSRAALTFGFLGLGTARDRVLLAPSTPGVAEARAEGACALAQSLAVLVPEEGRRLADKLVVRFRAAAEGAPMHYVPAELDADALAVHRHAVELYAELALICIEWEPDPGKRGTFDEVLDSVRAVAPLFDERVLEAMLKDRADDAPPHALRFFQRVIRGALEIDSRELALDQLQKQQLAGFLIAHLRTSLVQRRWDEAEGTVSAHELEQLVEQLDIARKDNARVARLEFWAARLALAGDYHEDCAAAIARFHAIVDGDHPMLGSIEKLQHALDERKKTGKGKKRDGTSIAATGPGGDAKDLAAREAELETQPTSMHLYAELCHELGLANRWRDAHAWAARALARCLTPAGQVRARELGLELSGLEALAAKDPGAVASFVAGARASALGALERIPSGDSGLEYVRGLALLAGDRRAEAQEAFRTALARCTRGIYMAVLRPLATDIEAAVLDAAKQEVDAACAEGRFADAFARLAERMATVAKPEPYLIELARTQLAAILPTLGTAQRPVAPPPIRTSAAWRAELAATEALDAYARTRALVALAARVHEPSVRDAAALGRKLDDLEDQLAMAAALEESTKRATAGDLVGALHQLADLGPAGDRSARVLRQRAIVLLKLERYDEADAAVHKLADVPEPLAREFGKRYPSLAFRQRLATATNLVRAKNFPGARAMLDAARPAGVDAGAQELELAYTRAYCAAAEGYKKGEGGDREGARVLLFEALRHVEARLEQARTERHERLLELHKKLETDLEHVESR